jgi:phosphatase NudJ
MESAHVPVKDPHGDQQFKPNTTVAAVIVDGDKFLMVEEVENGQTVYNQPAGHVEANENIIAGSQREILEETGLALTPEYCCGVYYYFSEARQLYFLRFCFVIELNHANKQPLIDLFGQDDKMCIKCTAQDDDIVATHWFTYEQIKAREKQLRSPMVIECIDDYLASVKIDLSVFKSNI